MENHGNRFVARFEGVNGTFSVYQLTDGTFVVDNLFFFAGGIRREVQATKLARARAYGEDDGEILREIGEDRETT